MERDRAAGLPLTDDEIDRVTIESEDTRSWDMRLTVEVVDNRYGNDARIFPHDGLGGSKGRLLRYVTSWQCGGTSDGKTG